MHQIPYSDFIPFAGTCNGDQSFRSSQSYLHFDLLLSLSLFLSFSLSLSIYIYMYHHTLLYSKSARAIAASVERTRARDMQSSSAPVHTCSRHASQKKQHAKATSKHRITSFAYPCLCHLCLSEPSELVAALVQTPYKKYNTSRQP
jgi:hypothetical protein